MGSDRRRSRWVVESTEEEERFALRICACWSIEIRRPWLSIETLRGGDKEKKRVRSLKYTRVYIYLVFHDDKPMAIRDIFIYLYDFGNLSFSIILDNFYLFVIFLFF